MIYKTQGEITDEKELLSPPGDTLSGILEARGMSQAELARRMGRPLKTINEIVKGKAAITPETALQLESVVTLPAEFWLERERLYRLKIAEIAAAEQMLEDAAWLQNFPLAKAKKLNWISFENNILSKAKAVYAYFGVSGRPQYEALYHQKVATCNYRLGKTGSEKELNPFAVAMWLRQGEKQADELKAETYNARLFQNSLQEAKNLMAAMPADFFEQLRMLCTKAGVKLVHTPCIPGTPMHGATYWKGNTPLIQLSNNYKRADIFWFNFFHEAAHILLHSKGDLFVEGLAYSREQQKKEDEANAFSADFMLTQEQEEVFRAAQPHTAASVVAYAKACNTHPGALWGRFARGDKDMNIAGWQHNFYQKVVLSDN